MKCKLGDRRFETKYNPGDQVWIVKNIPTELGHPRCFVVSEHVAEIRFYVQIHGVRFKYIFWNLGINERNDFEESDLYATKEEADKVAEERRAQWTGPSLKNTSSTKKCK